MFFAALCNCYALNFLALGTFSPLSNFSAPTFLPSFGQPDFLDLNKLQEESKMARPAVMIV